jgi:hypothetical protein
MRLQCPWWVEWNAANLTFSASSVGELFRLRSYGRLTCTELNRDRGSKSLIHWNISVSYATLTSDLILQSPSVWQRAFRLGTMLDIYTGVNERSWNLKVHVPLHLPTIAISLVNRALVQTKMSDLHWFFKVFQSLFTGTELNWDRGSESLIHWNVSLSYATLTSELILQSPSVWWRAFRLSFQRAIHTGTE